MLPCRIIGVTITGDNTLAPIVAPNKEIVGDSSASGKIFEERYCEGESKDTPNIEKIYDVLMSGSTVTDLTTQQHDLGNEKKLLRITKNCCTPILVNLETRLETTLNENQQEIIYLMNMNCVVFIKIHTQSANASLVNVLHYNFRDTMVKKKSLNTPFQVGQLATCKFVLVCNQLFVCCKSPIHFCLVDFSEKIRAWDWSSESNASRFLVCKNNVVIINNQQHCDTFLCLTLHRGIFHELYVKKHPIFMKDECYELPLVLNVRGKLIWIAQRESTLKLLQIKGDHCLDVFRSYDFNSFAGPNQTRLQVKNVFSSWESFLFVPLFCGTNESDCSFASGYEVAVIDMYTFDLSFSLKADLDLNIYSDTIQICVLHHGLVACAKVLRRSTTGLHTIFLSKHTFSMNPRNLKELTKAVVLNTFSMNELKTLDLPNIFYELVG